MTCADFSGDVEVGRRDTGEVIWRRADERIHVARALMKHSDELRRFYQYEGACAMAGAWVHASRTAEPITLVPWST